MTLKDDLNSIRRSPVVLKVGEAYPSNGYHESVLRSYHIVQLVKRMLKDRVPPDYILGLIEFCENDPTDVYVTE